MIRTLVFLSVLFALGCATPDIRGCRDGEGYSLGFEDALYGFPKTQGDNREKACHGIGAKLDDKRYQQGFNSGLKKFCKTEYGYEFGIQGQLYQKSCPKGQEEKFLSGYVAGRKKYLSDEISDRKDLIETINSDLKRKQKRSVAEEVSKLKLRKETVTQELTRLEKDLSELEK